MKRTLAHLFTPGESNNYKPKALHLSSLSIFMIIIMFSQVMISFLGKSLPGVLGLASTITSEDLIELTNKNRVENGLPELSLNPDLVKAAQFKATDMIQNNYWAHTSPQGKTPWSFFKQANYNYLYAGENLARDFYTSENVIEAWMSSPTHRDNILSSRYQEIGIVVINDIYQGQETTLVVQFFGTQPREAVQATVGKVGQQAEAVLAEISSETLIKKIPVVSSFELTKAMSISLTVLLLVVVVIDTYFITKKKIVRLSGKGLAHLVFLGIMLFLLLSIQPGLIL